MSHDQKHDAIIEAAIRRFAHYGVGKTTMNEIASDLSISKALLYYYFPDKKNLFAAVFKHITAVNNTNVEKAIADFSDPVQAISIFLEKRTEFIIKYYNILEFFKTYKAGNMPKELEKIFSDLKQRELNVIKLIINLGVKQKTFIVTDVNKVSELYFDFLDGYRFNTLSRNHNLFPEKKQFQAILKKEKEFSEIFFKGLSA